MNMINWLVVWNIFYFFHRLRRGTPTDERIFFRRGRYTTNQLKMDDLGVPVYPQFLGNLHFEV